MKVHNPNPNLVRVRTGMGAFLNFPPNGSGDLEEKLAKKLIKQKVLVAGESKAATQLDEDDDLADAEPTTVDEYKAALDKAGVQYPSNALLPELRKLYGAKKA